jgi:hypothetical protein
VVINPPAPEASSSFGSLLGGMGMPFGNKTESEGDGNKG